MAALQANEERDAQGALATAMRQLLGEDQAGEEALRSEAKLLRTITANVSSALVLLDSRSHPLFINPAAEALFGYSLAEIKDAPLHDAVHHHYPDGRVLPAEECPIAAAVIGRTALRDERAVFIRKDGTSFPVRCDVSPLQTAGQQVGALLEVRDRSAEAGAEEAKRDLVALIAHDLRTPLTALQVHVQLLQRRSAGAGPDEAASLDAIAAGGRRIGAMIQELLDASPLESGVVPLSCATVDLTALISRVIADVPSEEDRERITISAGEEVVAFADAARLERVIANVLGNAFKYSPPRAPVRISVRRGEAEAVVSVADRGPGMPPDQLPLLFQRYIRLDRSRSHPDRPDPGGTGLGLYIARLIVEAHGGRIWAESEVGAGTTITFAIPVEART